MIMKQFACDEADEDHGGVIQRTRGRCYEGGFAEGLPLSVRDLSHMPIVVVYFAKASAYATGCVGGSNCPRQHRCRAGTAFPAS